MTGSVEASQPLRRGARAYALDALSAFRGAPIEVMVGITLAIAFAVSMRGDDEETWFRFAASAALALPALLALSTLALRGAIDGAARWGASAVVLLAAAAYGRWVLDGEPGSGEGLRFLALLGGVVMAMALSPAARLPAGTPRREAVWRFNVRLLTRMVVVIAYAVALFAALAGAVAAVSSLFDLTTSDQVYGDLAAAVFLAMVPWMVVGGLPSYAAASEGAEAEAAPIPVRLLGRYLYVPVLAIYLAILLAYALRVLVTGEAPKNLLSPIILVAGLFGYLGSVLLEALRRDPEHPAVSRLIRFLPVPMLLLLPFALWAVWVRLDQYGWTEFRYLRFALLLALGALSLVGVARLVTRREPVMLLVPAVLGLTLLLSSVGPWSATQVSRRSQQERLREGLASAGLLQDGKAALPPPRASGAERDTLVIPGEAYERIAGSLVYLHQEHGPGAVQPFFSDELVAYESGSSILSALRISASCTPEEPVRYVQASMKPGAPIPGLPGGTLYRLMGDRPGRGADSSAVARLAFDDRTVRVTIRDDTGEWSAAADLSPLVARLTAASRTDCTPGRGDLSLPLTPAEARRSLVDARGVVRGEIVLTAVHVGSGPAGPREPEGPPRQVDWVEALVVVPGE